MSNRSKIRRSLILKSLLFPRLNNKNMTRFTIVNHAFISLTPYQLYIRTYVQMQCSKNSIEVTEKHHYIYGWTNFMSQRKDNGNS